MSSLNRGMRARLVAVVLLLAALVAGCARTTSSTEVAPVDAPNTAPATRGTPEIQPDQPGGGGPALSLPSLPVGGGSTPVEGTPGLSCASVNWVVDPAGPGALRPGISVTITGLGTDPPDFRLSRSSCAAGVPSCFGYTFSAASGTPACVVAAWAQHPGAEAVLLLSGQVRCDDVPAEACQAFYAAARETTDHVTIADGRAIAEDSDEASPRG